MPEPIRIFVGCSANNEDLESMVVLDYSIRKYASRPAFITWMQLSKDPASPFYSDGALGWQTKLWATPFSGFRWAIPELCGYQGRGIYFDSDFIVRADVAELHAQQINAGKVVVATGGNRYCCSLWDCAAARGNIRPLWELMGDPKSSAKLTHQFQHSNLVQPFADGSWNKLDVALPADINHAGIKAIHYTQVPTQLQLKYAVPRLAAEGQKHWYKGHVRAHPRADLQKLFDDLYVEANAAGFTIDKYRVLPYGPYCFQGG